MDTIIKLVGYDKKTEFLANETIITHLFTEKELRILLGEKEELYACYPITTLQQQQYIEKRLHINFSEKYDYFIEISGDWTLDLSEAVWIPAPASTFTDKDPMDRLDAEKAFLSDDPEKIIDALIRVTFFDPEPFYIQQKCIACLKSKYMDVQREAVVCTGHLVRIHGKVDVNKIVPLLKKLTDQPNFAEPVEEALDDIEAFLHVKRQTDDDDDEEEN